MRPIDAEALIHELNNSHYPGAPYIDAGISIAIGKVCDAPTIKLKRKTATWIIDSGYPQHCWCSNCNHRFDLFDPKSIHFCPNCGREMKTCIWKSLDEREKE